MVDQGNKKTEVRIDLLNKEKNKHQANMSEANSEHDSTEEEVNEALSFSEGGQENHGFDVTKASDEQGNSPPLWLITFTDVMALMLTFFVLLYSMAVPEEDLWTEMTSALNSEIGQFYSQEWEEGNQESINIDKIDNTKALNLDYLESIVRELVGKEEALVDIVIIPQSDHLVISLPDDLLFDSGQTKLQERGRHALFALAGALSRIKNRIEVIGHADPTPIVSSSGPYPSNWELSLARGLEVAGFLENVGYSRSMVVRGLSSARYDELPDLLEEERLNYARRVDIVVMKDDGRSSGMLNFGN